MIDPGEVRDALQLHGVDMDRAAFRLAVGLTGRTSGAWFLQVKGFLVDGMSEAVLETELPTLEEFDVAAAEDEAWNAAERLREEGVR